MRLRLDKTMKDCRNYSKIVLYILVVISLVNIAILVLSCMIQKSFGK